MLYKKPVKRLSKYYDRLHKAAVTFLIGSTVAFAGLLCIQLYGFFTHTVPQLQQQKREFEQKLLNEEYPLTVEDLEG
ncbi:unnamed protein product [Soboliphyme baturini]|uniref:Cytochrome c oxidase assembly factor 3 n=1 Tax=Soboliphyme baturini TaxID=241478 RepID=A0A183J6Z3_9BILA|nr:unnamed protein product [Soboliphyme baturini]